MIKNESIIYKGCLIVKKASNNFYIYMEAVGEKKGTSLDHAKAIINTFHSNRFK